MRQGGGQNTYGGKNTREFKDQEYYEHHSCESLKHCVRVVWDRVTVNWELKSLSQGGTQGSEDDCTLADDMG